MLSDQILLVARLLRLVGKSLNGSKLAKLGKSVTHIKQISSSKEYIYILDSSLILFFICIFALKVVILKRI
jgi:hypothetical protein